MKGRDVKVDILHNTTEENGRMAIFARFGEGPTTRPGDTLSVVGSLELDGTPETAAEAAFVAGNSPLLTPETETYRNWRVRSFSAGDVVRIHLADGSTVGLVCKSYGFAPIDLSLYTVLEK
jgi:hypothetical protein